MNEKAERYMNPYLAGFFLGLVLFASYMLFGQGLGASGGFARIVGKMVDIVAPAHVNQNAYLISQVHGHGNPLDFWLVYEVLGVLIGGFISGLAMGRLKPATCRGPHTSVQKRWAMALLGGTIAGFGVRLARGCTSGQALSGGAVLSAGSWAFMFAVFAGGYATAWFFRKVWN